jgi:4-amino-4-deoxy-L-arabinose transferase-like glycosyltransferase
LVFAGVLLGLGFLTKMMQAFLVLPGFGIAYLWAGPARLRRRLWQLLAGLGGVIAGAGWWVAIVELVPTADRPYFGGSTNNNILELALGYNGLGRLSGSETGSIGGGGGGSGFPGGTGFPGGIGRPGGSAGTGTGTGGFPGAPGSAPGSGSAGSGATGFRLCGLRGHRQPRHRRDCQRHWHPGQSSRRRVQRHIRRRGGGRSRRH